MGQGLSCAGNEEQLLFAAVRLGDLETVRAVLDRNSTHIRHSTVFDRNSALHIAASHGQIEVLLSLSLDSISFFPSFVSFFGFNNLFCAFLGSFVSSGAIDAAGFVESA